MYKVSYDALTQKFIEGRQMCGYDSFYRERCYYGPVSIPEILRLHHIRTKTVGLLTHIGQEQIGIRDAHGDLIEGEYKTFMFLSPAGLPYVEELHDFFGNALQPNDYVTFACTQGLCAGRIAKISSIGTIMIDANIKYYDGSSDIKRVKVPLANDCMRLPDDHPMIDEIKMAIQTI